MTAGTTARPVDVTKRRAKVLSILREQRVRILEARSHSHELRPHRVVALVKGHLGRYAIDLVDGAWTCTCREGATGACAHAWAVRFVTGHGTGDMPTKHDGVTDGGSTARCRACGDQGTCPDCVNA